MPGMGAAERPGEQPVAAERVENPEIGGVDRQQHGDDRRDGGQIHEIGVPAADIAHREIVQRCRGAGQRIHMARAISDDHRIHGEGEPQPGEDDRAHQGDREVAAGIAAFLRYGQA